MLTTRLSTSLNITPKGSSQAPAVTDLAEQAKIAGSKADSTPEKIGRPSNTPVTLKADTVSLSDEARAASANERTPAEQKASERLNQKALHKLASSETEQQQVEKSEQDAATVEALIKKIEQQIRELEEKIAELTGRTDEASIEQLKMLTGQLMMLNSQLLELQTRKAEMNDGGSGG
ncbi:hypothetical protein [Thalassomonas haliotis]|uniref:Uncharacterized protein n=1 Tax=Thalassomonas haliotis TaxID=485448 RepID=A0ABY7VI36_9GAMM|nr:hypothetical protein [Thalassomonas haliotis]WDE13397.1 hypothetical protein H3N35_08155 [Thalassomonas haliotis]